MVLEPIAGKDKKDTHKLRRSDKIETNVQSISESLRAAHTRIPTDLGVAEQGYVMGIATCATSTYVGRLA